MLVETWLVDRRDAARARAGNSAAALERADRPGAIRDSASVSAKRGSEEKQAMVRVLFNGAVLLWRGCAGQEDKGKGGCVRWRRSGTWRAGATRRITGKPARL